MRASVYGKTTLNYFVKFLNIQFCQHLKVVAFDLCKSREHKMLLTPIHLDLKIKVYIWKSILYLVTLLRNSGSDSERAPCRLLQCRGLSIWADRGGYAIFCHVNDVANSPNTMFPNVFLQLLCQNFKMSHMQAYCKSLADIDSVSLLTGDPNKGTLFYSLCFDRSCVSRLKLSCYFCLVLFGISS